MSRNRPEKQRQGSGRKQAAAQTDAAATLAAVQSELAGAAAEIVPRFLDIMPAAYFMATDEATRRAHLKALIAAAASGLSQEIMLRSDDEQTFTVITEHDYPGKLGELIQRLRTGYPLRSVKAHTATDGSLILDVFEFGEGDRYDAGAPEIQERIAAIRAYAEREAPHVPGAAIDAHLARCTMHYLRDVTPLRFCRHLGLFERANGTEDAVIDFEPCLDVDSTRIAVAVANVKRQLMFEIIARRLGRLGCNIRSAYLDVFNNNQAGQIALLSFVVVGPEGGALDEGSALWRAIRCDLIRLKWIDRAARESANAAAGVDLLHAEVLLGLCHLAHQILAKRDAYRFARERITDTARRYPSPARETVQLLLERFRPEAPLADAVFAERATMLRETLRREVDSSNDLRVMETLVDVVEATLRTNVYLPGRYALALRIDPRLLACESRETPPYGAFFVHGREFDGFHVRFRDIARGGVRIVRPRSLEQHALEAERLYDENYGLALAQQLKNKDIPEGGSKGVVLVTPDADIARCCKAYADALLDLITPEEATRKLTIDRFGREELLYLGPDENVTNELIEWIVDRAARREYPLPNAFMSSKPGAGINHKEFGVTSEGVNVFLDVALRAHGIDPRRRPFTIKLTGGPDGDVAGNMIRILFRDYGDNARIVGIADGSGSAEDPAGLDREELLRLVGRAAPIAAFDPRRLSPAGRVRTIDAEGGIKARNTLHNRVIADAFVPAGGRPRMIDAENWAEFFVDEHTPSSPIIVEGANLFLTAEAREALSERGVTIVKDSSANKCGVICSSFEILASMLIDEDAFLRIKPQFVEQVLAKLRELARREAELLFREREHQPHVSLARLSMRLSEAIIRATDAIADQLGALDREGRARAEHLFLEHVPAVLRECAGADLFERLPVAYVDYAIASLWAARIVYREGLHFFESMPAAAIVALAQRYLREEHETESLAAEIEAADLPHSARIAALLREGGTRSSLRLGGNADA